MFHNSRALIVFDYYWDAVWTGCICTLMTKIIKLQKLAARIICDVKIIKSVSSDEFTFQKS